MQNINLINFKNIKCEMLSICFFEFIIILRVFNIC